MSRSKSEEPLDTIANHENWMIVSNFLKSGKRFVAVSRAEHCPIATFKAYLGRGPLKKKRDGGARCATPANSVHSFEAASILGLRAEKADPQVADPDKAAIPEITTLTYT